MAAPIELAVITTPMIVESERGGPMEADYSAHVVAVAMGLRGPWQHHAYILGHIGSTTVDRAPYDTKDL